MEDDARFEALAEACLKAHEAVADVGSPTMLAITRALLRHVGQEVIRREARRENMLRDAEAIHGDRTDLASGHYQFG